MNRLLIVGILLLSTMLPYAEAQQPNTAKLKADAQKLVSNIRGDKAKTQAYCQINSLGGYGGNIYYGRSADDQDNEVDKVDRELLAETNTEAVQSCGDLAPGVTNLPIEQIRQSVHSTADQESTLDDLSAAASQASDMIRSSCPMAVPLTPVGRLDAAEQRL